MELKKVEDDIVPIYENETKLCMIENNEMGRKIRKYFI